MILAEPDLESALEAIHAAAQKKEIPRCIGLAREQADMLSSAGRHASVTGPRRAA